MFSGRDRWPDDDGVGWLFKIVLGALAASIVVPILVFLALYAAFKSFSAGSLPPEKPTVISGITRVYDDAGKQIGLLREFDLSIPVTQEDIPDVLKEATVAIEDQRFYSHSGVDDRAVLRAVWADLTGGGYVEGASTITQQYARLVYTGTEKTIRRKLEEAGVARKIEKSMSKDEILYRYLDRVYLGDGAYGVGAASQSYFRKPVKDLTLSEAALLAGLIRQPSVNNPRNNPSGAESARLLVLDRMLAQGRISQGEYSEAAAQKVFLAEPAYQPDGPATVIQPRQEQQADYPFFVDYVRRYLIAKYGEEKVYQGGLKVYSSLSPSLQAKAEKAVSDTLKGTTSPLDMAIVSLDPRTGLVRALVGGRDFANSQVNLALGSCNGQPAPKDGGPICVDGGGTGRQPGSAFKPITLARAIEEGISVDKVYSGPSSYTFPRCTGEGCTVSNVESSGYGSLTLRAATARSVNTVYAQLIGDVGVKDTAEMAHRLGLTMVNADGTQPNGEPYGPSLTLGAAETSPLDMAAAFGVFANRGEQLPAAPVTRVEEPDGKVLEDNVSRKPKRVLQANVADLVNDVLKDVIAYGTGSGADFGHPNGVAGKTGTSEDYGDAWFVGYTPQLSTAVWFGYTDGRRSLTNIKGNARVYGATFGVPTWKAFMTAAEPELNLTDFPKPGPPPTIAPAPRPTVTARNGLPTTAPTPTYTLPTAPTTVYVPPVYQPTTPPTTRRPTPTTAPRGILPILTPTTRPPSTPP
ncbi:MAG: transglycosylase domain-containing protein [Acidimicrobiales bacterium]